MDEGTPFSGFLALQFSFVNKKRLEEPKNTERGLMGKETFELGKSVYSVSNHFWVKINRSLCSENPGASVSFYNNTLGWANKDMFFCSSVSS